MEKNTATERLATYLIGLGVLTIVGVTCWYFREVILMGGHPVLHRDQGHCRPLLL